jgi:hypothetical protein
MVDTVTEDPDDCIAGRMGWSCAVGKMINGVFNIFYLQRWPPLNPQSALAQWASIARSLQARIEYAQSIQPQWLTSLRSFSAKADYEKR